MRRIVHDLRAGKPLMVLVHMMWLLKQTQVLLLPHVHEIFGMQWYMMSRCFFR